MDSRLSINENTPLVPIKTDEPARESLGDLKGHVKPLIASFSMSIISGLNDGTLGTIIPRLKKYYSISNETVSLLFLCSAFGFFLSASVNGFVVHRLGQLKTIYLGAFLQLASYLVMTMGFPFPVMAVAMTASGLGIAFTDAAMNVLVANLPLATLMLNILHALYGVGAMMSPLVATVLLGHDIPWNGMYVFLTLAAIINITIITIGFSGTNLDGDEEVDNKEDRSSVVRAAILHPMTIIGAIYILIYVGNEVVLGGWGYTYLTEGRHGDSITMGRVISSYWAGLACGRLVLGYLAGKFGEKLMITVFTMMIICCLTTMSISADVVVSSSGLILAGFLLGPMFPTTISLASKVLPRNQHTTSIGFMSALGAGGAAFFPFITGLISGKFGILSMTYVSIAMAVGMLILWSMIPSNKPLFGYFQNK